MGKTEPFYVAIITPVIHYCMGGLEVDTNSLVVNAEGKAIKGLYAAGEVAGGIHGNNRLGGTPCWTASFSVASLADMLPSTCWAQTGRTLLWQFSRAQPECDTRLSPGLQSDISPASWGHCSRSLG